VSEETPKALYRKHRPGTWEQVSGQDHVTQTLRNAVAGGRIGHAYLFSGQRGTGKTSVARILAKAANCLDEDPKARPCNKCTHCQAVNDGMFLDLIEIDAASNTGVEDIRDLRDKINFSPNQGRYKVYIIDEVHMLSKNAFNALLKTLEEPPSHVIFILATTEINKIPATVLSRCQRHEFKRATLEEITRQLTEIARKENIKVDEDALAYIGRQATGSFRDAISLLDQMASSDKKITLDYVHSVLGTTASHNVMELVDAMQEEQPAKALDLIHQALDAGTDPRQLAYQVVNYLRTLLLIKLGNPGLTDMTKEMLKEATRQAKGFSRPMILEMLEAFQEAGTDLRGGWYPSLRLELALAQVMEIGDEKPAEVSQKSIAEKKDSFPVRQETKDQQTVKTSSETATRQKKTPTNDDFSRLTRDWKQVSNAVRSNGSLNALLNSCRLMSLKKGVLTLGFSSDLLREKADTPEQIKTIQETIASVFDMDLKIRCVVSKARQETPADIKQDGMVAEALKYGARISDIQD
jgi:DNA polymerase III subunit gamma/tau